MVSAAWVLASRRFAIGAWSWIDGWGVSTKNPSDGCETLSDGVLRDDSAGPLQPHALLLLALLLGPRPPISPARPLTSREPSSRAPPARAGLQSRRHLRAIKPGVGGTAHSVLTSHTKPVPTTPYSPAGGTTAHSVLTSHTTPYSPGGGTTAHSVLTSHTKPVPTTPYSPGGGTTAHSVLTPHRKPPGWRESKNPYHALLHDAGVAQLASLLAAVTRALQPPPPPPLSAFDFDPFGAASAPAEDETGERLPRTGLLPYRRLRIQGDKGAVGIGYRFTV
jgi:hypothetical protein